MAKAGRPHKEIDKEQFEKLCAMHCTLLEICAFFDVTDKTLENWCKRTYDMKYSEICKIKRQIGKISLRRSQYELAKKNANLSIWLGKQWLGQTDNAVAEEKENNAVDEFVNALNSKAEEAWNDEK